MIGILQVKANRQRSTIDIDVREQKRQHPRERHTWKRASGGDNGNRLAHPHSFGIGGSGREEWKIIFIESRLHPNRRQIGDIVEHPPFLNVLPLAGILLDDVASDWRTNGEVGNRLASLENLINLGIID